MTEQYSAVHQTHTVDFISVGDFFSLSYAPQEALRRRLRSLSGVQAQRQSQLHI